MMKKSGFSQSIQKKDNVPTKKDRAAKRKHEADLRSKESEIYFIPDQKGLWSVAKEGHEVLTIKEEVKAIVKEKSKPEFDRESFLKEVQEAIKQRNLSFG